MRLDNQKINNIKNFIYSEIGHEGSGHDWYHALRVYKLAMLICDSEEANKIIIAYSAFLHDLIDRKIKTKSGAKIISTIKIFLKKENIESSDIDGIIHTMRYTSFSSRIPNKKTMEWQIIQDADKLDALGAIGIARAFAYGGHAGRMIYDPGQKTPKKFSKSYYYQAKSSSLNHFEEKLFKLKKLMHTSTAKRIAQNRERYMKDFVKKFLNEWEGKE